LITSQKTGGTVEEPPPNWASIQMICGIGIRNGFETTSGQKLDGSSRNERENEACQQVLHLQVSGIF